MAGGTVLGGFPTDRDERLSCGPAKAIRRGPRPAERRKSRAHTMRQPISGPLARTREAIVADASRGTRWRTGVRAGTGPAVATTASDLSTRRSGSWSLTCLLQRDGASFSRADSDPGEMSLFLSV